MVTSPPLSDKDAQVWCEIYPTHIEFEECFVDKNREAFAFKYRTKLMHKVCCTSNVPHNHFRTFRCARRNSIHRAYAVHLLLAYACFALLAIVIGFCPHILAGMAVRMQLCVSPACVHMLSLQARRRIFHREAATSGAARN